MPRSMPRLFCAATALALSLGMLSSLAATPSPEPKVIGENEPVNLGRMVVTATPL